MKITITNKKQKVTHGKYIFLEIQGGAISGLEICSLRAETMSHIPSWPLPNMWSTWAAGPSWYVAPVTPAACPSFGTEYRKTGDGELEVCPYSPFCERSVKGGPHLYAFMLSLSDQLLWSSWKFPLC